MTYQVDERLWEEKHKETLKRLVSEEIAEEIEGLQKADRGITKIEKEEEQLARVLRIWKQLTRQRKVKGKWK
jgi:hypothetical protein